MSNKILPAARIIILLTSIAMITVLFLPIWRIALVAPQYPEGLTMKIWASKLTGNVDVINGLNHYIGMKTLHEKDFIEFKILPWIIMGYSVLGVIVFFHNRRIYFRMYAILFVIIAVVCMADFYRWEYNYGHDLDPNAPIQVPGMAYQPPFIGYKKLLNFSAYSFPDSGGFVFIACGVLMVGAAIWEWWKYSRAGRKLSVGPLTAIVVVLSSIMSCNYEAQPINYGSDECSFCKMTIMSRKYSGEIITAKGKVYKFDDSHCLVSFLNDGAMKSQKVAAIYLNDFSGDHNFLKPEESFLLRSQNLATPMGGNVAAFSNADSLLLVQRNIGGEKVSWDQINISN